MKIGTKVSRKPLYVGLLLLVCATQRIFTQSAPDAPSWWSSQGVINGHPPNDYAAANQGQVKNIARAAAAMMDAQLPGGAGDAVHALVNSWATPTAQTNDFAAVNLGQLKSVAKPFYDVLIAGGWRSGYPWNGSVNAPADYAIANIGQVKNIFSFDLTPLAWPTHVTATPVGDGTVQVGWTYPSVNIPGFTIQRSDDGGQTWTTVGNVSGQTKNFSVPSDAVGANGSSRFRVVLSGTGGNTAQNGSGGTPAAPDPDPDDEPTAGAPIPIQDYAFIDMSGSSVTSDVTMVSMDDNNNAAFAYTSGTVTFGWNAGGISDQSGYGEWGVTSASNLNVFTWAGGTVSPASIISLVANPGPQSCYPSPSDGSRTFGAEFLAPSYITPSGTVYGADTSGSFAYEQYEAFALDCADAAPIGSCGFSSDGQKYGSLSQLQQTMLPSRDNLINWTCFWILGGNSNAFFAHAQDASVTPNDPDNYSRTFNFSVIHTGNDSTSNYTYFYPGDQSVYWNNRDNDVLPSPTTQIDSAFMPLAVNSSGHAVGSGSNGQMLYYDGITVLPALPLDGVHSLNNQDELIGTGTDAMHPNSEGILLESGSYQIPQFLADLVPKELKGELRQVNPLLISNRSQTDSSITIFCTALSGTASGYYLWTRGTNSLWTIAQAHFPAPVRVTHFSSLTPQKNLATQATITTTGTDGTTSTNAQKGLNLPPVQLTNKADPTVRNGAKGNDKPISFMQSGSDTNINCVAWIAANDPTNNNAPRMPQLVATSGSIPGLTYCWKLQVTFHDRHGNPHRDFDTGDPNDSNSSPNLLTDPIVHSSNQTADTPDQVTIPAVNGSTDPKNVNGWHQITDGSPWVIYDSTNSPDWNAAVAQGFFGGDAVLSLKILDGNGTIMPEQDYKFRTAGENPTQQSCEAFIKANNGGFWYADAIAREETDGEGSNGYYNHFLTSGGKSSANPIKVGVPNWNNDGTYPRWKNGVRVGRWTGSGGYGLFQLTYQAANNPNDTGDANYILHRDWIWNWQSNMAPAINKLSGKQTSATSLYNWLVSEFGSSIQSQRCPTSGDNQNAFNAYEGIVIGEYNGNDGFERVTAPDQSKKWSPWQLANGQWSFTGTYAIKVAGYVQ